MNSLKRTKEFYSFKILTFEIFWVRLNIIFIMNFSDP